VIYGQAAALGQNARLGRHCGALKKRLRVGRGLEGVLNSKNRSVQIKTNETNP
jgi:hypothetical protein